MLPCHSARVFRAARLSFLLLLIGSSLALAGGKHRKVTPSPSPSAAHEDLGLKNIPLTVGHVAKGLIMPNYDLRGNLLGRFEAGTAARLDENHVRFTNLNIQTFDQKQKPDLNVLMSDSVLDLETRVIETNRRSTIKRADFEIAGDSMQFNTVTHQGTMHGNVHMTIFNQNEIAGSAAKKK